MASQPPVQFNQIPPSIPNVTGVSRPPLIQPPTINGMGQPQPSTYPSSPAPNFSAVSNPASLQWARPPIAGQGSIPNQLSQPISSMPGQQQYNPAGYGQNSPRPPPPGLNLGRPPGPPSLASPLSGSHCFVISTFNSNFHLAFVQFKFIL